MSQQKGRPYQNIRKAGGNKFNSIDVHELLRAEILSQGVDANTDSAVVNASGNNGGGGDSGAIVPAPSSGPLVSPIGFDDTYLYFDSLAKNAGSSNLLEGQITFNIPPLNNGFPVENIIAMSINSFYFPRITLPNTQPDFFFFGRMYLQVTSSSLPSTQSVQAQNGNRYQYEFDVDSITSVAVKLDPVRNLFYFTKPILSLSDISFTFSVPPGFKAVPIPNDTIIVTGLAGTNPARFTVISSGDSTAAIGAVGVPAAPGVAVYISNFVSPSSTLNNTVNNTGGYFVDNILSTTDFTISALNFTTLGVNTNATVVIGKNRIGIEVKFLSSRNLPTNYLVGVHQ